MVRDGAFGALPFFLSATFTPPAVAQSYVPAGADALRDSAFQFVSALSCTGFQSAPIGDWSAGGNSSSRG